MILVDTGPLVALFDPVDGQHERCVLTLKSLREPIQTTVPVLTEAFHMLGPETRGSDRLREFIVSGGLSVWFFDRVSLTRAFELMELYADHPMDLADAYAAPSESVEDLVARREMSAAVRQAMTELPDEQRTAIMLKEYQGFTFQEIADLLDCPLSTVKTRLYQGLSVLRRRLERRQSEEASLRRATWESSSS